MTIEIKAPTFPESVADGTVATWHKKPGEAVSRDELIVDIETDKVVLEIVAPDDGAISEIIKDEGDTVESEELLGHFEPGAGGSEGDEKAADSSSESADDAPAEETSSASDSKSDTREQGDNDDVKMSPAARKLVAEKGLDASRITATGKGGLVTKEDVLNHASGESSGSSRPAPDTASKSAESQSSSQSAPAANKPAGSQSPVVEMDTGDKIEKRVPMTRLRKRIAERLLEATQTTAMLTTFNEVNMEPVMTLRKQYKDLFEKTHNGVRLGFMGFFVKATCEALKRFPGVNASIDGDDIVYHAYQDIGVAVSSDKGLVVPVLRDADNLGLASIEDRIRDFGSRAQDGKLALEEMQGGTFTITNGGVFGSLMSTPILNPPQTAILGMHKIQERPMAVDGEVKILPMMYLALSYDHRLIDGKEAVQFLVTIKEMLEEPARILLEV